MEVRDLAPALLALGDIFEEANSLLNHGKAKVAVSVKGSFKTGCFAIDISVVQSLFQQAIDLFNGAPVTAALNLAGLIGLGTGATTGALQLIRWTKGRPITKVEVINTGKVKVFCDDEHFETEQETLDLFRSFRLRKAFQELIHSPLQKEGIEYFAVRQGDQDFSAVSKPESRYFVAPEQEPEDLESSEREVSLQLVNIAFKDDNKWRFFDGISTFYASITDDDFLNRVDLNQEHFSKGDILKVRLREDKTLVGDQLKAEYQILAVLEHRRAASQLRLPIQG